MKRVKELVQVQLVQGLEQALELELAQRLAKERNPYGAVLAEVLLLSWRWRKRKRRHQMWFRRQAVALAPGAALVLALLPVLLLLLLCAQQHWCRAPVTSICALLLLAAWCLKSVQRHWQKRRQCREAGLQTLLLCQGWLLPCRLLVGCSTLWR